MTRRFSVVACAHGADPRVHGVGVPARPAAADSCCRTAALNWIQLLLATPVVLWGGWPFFVRGWASVVNRHLNMFTLIALGVGARTPSASSRRSRRGCSPTSFRTNGSGRRLLRAGGGDRRARAARPGAGTARAQSHRARRSATCSASRRRRRAASSRTAPSRTCRSSTCTSAIACACGPASACRWTASCSTARRRSTNRW